MLLRLPGYAGSLFLLYTMATGLSAQQAATPGSVPAMSQHGIAGIVGTLLCIGGIILLVRRPMP